MSFIDSVDYISQLSVVDEFGGRGDANKISCFYIVFRVMDDSGNNLQVSLEDIQTTLVAEVPGIVLTDYMGSTEWHIGILDNDSSTYFILDVVEYRNNANIIKVKVKDTFQQNAAICVKFQRSVTDDAGNVTTTELSSSCYLSDFPSTFYINKK